MSFVTRMDSVVRSSTETAYCLGVEQLLLGITDQIPERASVIRVMLMELNRISSASGRPGHRQYGLGAMSRDVLRVP